MAIKEQDIVFTTKDESGNTIIQMPITRAENIENIMSIEQGGTGSKTAKGARSNLGLSTAVTGASISGKTITLTKADGTTETLITQDTDTNNISASSVETNGYIKFNNGMIIQWGYFPHSGTTTNQVVTFPIAFSIACFSVVGSRTNGSAESYWPFLVSTDTVTTTQFKCHLSQNLYWIAIGK